MSAQKRVLIVGLEPKLIDFSSPEFAAFSGMSAEKIMEGLNSSVASLEALGYRAELCLTDFGETAESVLRDRLQAARFDCVVVGAGVRTAPAHFLLFEKLINIVHEHAPTSRIGFNTRPTDTAEAVKRWV